MKYQGTPCRLGDMAVGEQWLFLPGVLVSETWALHFNISQISATMSAQDGGKGWKGMAESSILYALSLQSA